MLKIKTAVTALLMVSLLGIAACNDDDGGEGAAATGAEGAGTNAKEGGDPILIKTHLAPPNEREETFGDVLSGSTIGDSEFCAGGKFFDGPVDPSDRSLVRTFRCSDGTLTVTFTSTPPDVEQRSDWKVVKGLRSFEGLRGGGRMRAVSESSGGGARETFTGTVVTP
jgi:hypothetical protein